MGSINEGGDSIPARWCLFYQYQPVFFFFSSSYQCAKEVCWSRLLASFKLSLWPRLIPPQTPPSWNKNNNYDWTHSWCMRLAIQVGCPFQKKMLLSLPPSSLGDLVQALLKTPWLDLPCQLWRQKANLGERSASWIDNLLANFEIYALFDCSQAGASYSNNRVARLFFLLPPEFGRWYFLPGNYPGTVWFIGSGARGQQALKCSIVNYLNAISGALIGAFWVFNRQQHFGFP